MFLRLPRPSLRIIVQFHKGVNILKSSGIKEMQHSVPIYLSNTIFPFSILPFPFLGICRRPWSRFSVSAALLPIRSVPMGNSLPMPPRPVVPQQTTAISTLPSLLRRRAAGWGLPCLGLRWSASPSLFHTSPALPISPLAFRDDCRHVSRLRHLPSILCLVHPTRDVHLSLPVTAPLPHSFSPLVYHASDSNGSLRPRQWS